MVRFQKQIQCLEGCKLSWQLQNLSIRNYKKHLANGLLSAHGHDVWLEWVGDGIPPFQNFLIRIAAQLKRRETHIVKS